VVGAVEVMVIVTAAAVAPVMFIEGVTVQVGR
jgi:hypothetical protein